MIAQFNRKKKNQIYDFLKNMDTEIRMHKEISENNSQNEKDNK